MSLVGRTLHLLMLRVRLLLLLLTNLLSSIYILLVLHVLEINGVLRLVNELRVSTKRVCTSMHLLATLGLVGINT